MLLETMPMGRGSLPDWRRQAAPLESPATMSTCSCNITTRTVSSNFFLSEMVVNDNLMLPIPNVVEVHGADLDVRVEGVLIE